MNFGATPWGTVDNGTRAGDHPQDGPARALALAQLQGKFTARSSVWDDNRIFLEP
jgi:hypothetical protein